jgi:hypothetical protein
MSPSDQPKSCDSSRETSTDDPSAGARCSPRRLAEEAHARHKGGDAGRPGGLQQHRQRPV